MTLILLAISLTITLCVIAWHLAIYALPVMTGITAFQYIYATGSGFWLSALAAIGAAIGSIIVLVLYHGMKAIGRATGTIVKEAPEPTPQERKFENLDEPIDPTR